MLVAGVGEGIEAAVGLAKGIRALVALGKAVEGGTSGVRAGLSNSEIVEAVARNADEVKIGRTAKDAGDFVNIKFKDGTVANIRVESHPPTGLHGNVQIWREGEEVINKHILP